jgi:hypothetical protein
MTMAVDWRISRLVLCGVPVLRAELHGTVTVRDELALVAALAEAGDDARGLIVDVTDVDTSGLSAADVKAMAANWETSRFGNQHPMVAYTTAREVFAVSNMLVAHWTPDRMHVFRSEREAIEWLAKRLREPAAH